MRRSKPWYGRGAKVLRSPKIYAAVGRLLKLKQARTAKREAAAERAEALAKDRSEIVEKLIPQKSAGDRRATTRRSP